MEEIKVPKSIIRLGNNKSDNSCPDCPDGKHIGLWQHEVSVEGWNELLDRDVRDADNKMKENNGRNN